MGVTGSLASWQLQIAKARLSELVRAAQERGPQQITLHGAAAAVVLSRQAYDRLVAAPVSLSELLHASPLRGARLALPRAEPAAPRRARPRRVRR